MVVAIDNDHVNTVAHEACAVIIDQLHHDDNLVICAAFGVLASICRHYEWSDEKVHSALARFLAANPVSPGQAVPHG